jgi:hypothetical protein
VTGWDPHVPAAVHIDWPADPWGTTRVAFLLCALMVGWAGGDVLAVLSFDYWTAR